VYPDFGKCQFLQYSRGAFATNGCNPYAEALAETTEGVMMRGADPFLDGV